MKSGLLVSCCIISLMIHRLSLKNFKLHASTTIEAAPITVLIGPNNSGKSSLLQALLCLRQAASRGRQNLCVPVQRQQTSIEQPYLFSPEHIIDIGKFNDVVRHGQKEIQIGVAVSLPRTEPLKYGGPVEINFIAVNFDVHVRNNLPVYHAGFLQSPLGRIPWEWSPRQPEQHVTIKVDEAELRFRTTADFRLLGYAGGSSPSDFPVEKSTDIREWGEYLGNAVVFLLNSVHPIFPLRGFEEWAYPLPGDAPANLDMITLHDRSLATTSILAYNRNLEERLSEWLQEVIGVGIKFHLIKGNRVLIRTQKINQKTSDTLFTSEGTGANQLPFILVPIGLTPANETIFLCEPEAHLHPKAQSGLVSLLLKIAKKENRQFFIETHSEHILHAFLHAIAKGELEKSQLAIYYFENVNGTAEVRQLEITPQGQVKGGLPGFFEHSLTELAEYLDALKKT